MLTSDSLAYSEPTFEEHESFTKQLSRRILLAKPNHGKMEILCHYLLNEGFCVITRDTGNKAINYVRDHVPDSIEPSLIFHGIDGLTVCRQHLIDSLYSQKDRLFRARTF